MGSNAIKICGDNTEVLSVELKDVLRCIIDGVECNWSILWLQAIGNIGNISMLDFEQEVKGSERGFSIEWKSLLDLSEKFDQVIEIVLIGDKSNENLRRYESDEEMYSSCQYTIELIDSSYWIIHSRSEQMLSQMENHFQGVEKI